MPRVNDTVLVPVPTQSGSTGYTDFYGSSSNVTVTHTTVPCNFPGCKATINYTLTFTASGPAYFVAGSVNPRDPSPVEANNLQINLYTVT